MKKLSLVEKILLAVVAALLTISLVLAFTNLEYFADRFTFEDGIVEWGTVLALLAGSFLCMYRFVNLWKYKRWPFLLFTFLFGLFIFFAAGEEISWGQRILNIETPEYFEKHNMQKETNFHNLVINGVRINRIFFSFFLIGALSIYLIIIPILYRSKEWMRSWMNSWGIPLPKTYQIVSFLLLFAIINIIPHEKKWEVLECGAALLFFLIICYPLNEEIFRKSIA